MAIAGSANPQISPAGTFLLADDVWISPPLTPTMVLVAGKSSFLTIFGFRIQLLWREPPI